MESIYIVTGYDPKDGQFEYEESSLVKAQELVSILKRQGIASITVMEYDTVTKQYHLIND